MAPGSPVAAKGPLNPKDSPDPTVKYSVETNCEEQATFFEYPSNILDEFKNLGLPADDYSLCELLPCSRAYRGLTAYCARKLGVPIVAIDKHSGKNCDEDEDENDTLGEWEDVEYENDDEEEDAAEENGEKEQSNGEKGTSKVVTKAKKKRRRRKIGPAPKVRVALGLGVYVLKFKEHTIYVGHYSRGTPVMNTYEQCTETHRAVILGVRGKSKKSVKTLEKFIQTAMDWARRDAQPCIDEGKFSLYRYKVRDQQGWWTNDGVKRGRPVESVILPDNLRDSIVDDLDNFLKAETKKWYLKHGLPHRRSYLFYGPPGTGKSSLIRALAGKFQLSACFLAMANKDFNNELLGDALHECPANALLVLEDVDCLFESRKANDGIALTFSGLLNALDGMMSSDGRVTIMTTNHLEKLDAAMIRCGRVDRRFEFAQPVKEQVQELFTTFYPDADKKLYLEFSRAVWNREEDEARSIATLQQFFIYCRQNTAEEAIGRIAEFFEAFFPDGPKRKNPMYT